MILKLVSTLGTFQLDGVLCSDVFSRSCFTLTHTTLKTKSYVLPHIVFGVLSPFFFSAYYHVRYDHICISLRIRPK
ncbi:hypothetical protein FRC0316_01396 [Corynebacterium diphtheriae]|nr:hypothetical protein FRC0016_01323 [Corynebacterium diphtheriae]CAB0801051.1 hypothetical protein FRC0213_01324 [Corynebacterium diphtheriae]CAB0802961.1 hypothetical protein FRC0191_01413 [Corynebacterium diphtheriae]CAB0845644.1 hypothetical protein FRC0295_01237 [Corynebacterium diphtheriae]CAB0847995.1 hypothetical protein FRC0316_01396 [Corynebacterium diphtheriae]